MADWNSADPDKAMESAMAMFEDESRKLAELGRHWDEASTTVRAKDHSLDMTFDGRGELVDLVFNSSKYRSLPPAQLAKTIVDTLRLGREQAQQKMTEVMGVPEIAGMDLQGVASGKVRPDELINSLIGPMWQTLDEFGVHAQRPRSANPEER